VADILTNVERFEFTSTLKERLDLFGTLVGWSDDIKTGVIEKQVVKRAGAIHQRVGAPPKRFEFKCVLQGPDCRARYNRICDVVLEEPEGNLSHPRFGTTLAVCEGISASETPGDARDTIEFTIRFSETGLRDAPKPAPSAAGQASATKGSEIKTATASSSVPGASAAGSTLSDRSVGLLVSVQLAERGEGTLLDVDASIAALVTAHEAFVALDVSQDMKRASFLCLGSALKARNAFIAGAPPIIYYTVESEISLSALCQTLYGSRGKDERDLILRLNRIFRPFSMPAGTKLLLTDPSVVVSS